MSLTDVVVRLAPLEDGGAREGTEAEDVEGVALARGRLRTVENQLRAVFLVQVAVVILALGHLSKEHNTHLTFVTSIERK